MSGHDSLDRDDRDWARRFQARKGVKAAMVDTLRRLHADPRWPTQTPTARNALDHALTTWADGDLRWQVKVKTWADAIGVARSTLLHATHDLEACELIAKTGYLRPGQQGQGATIYRLRHIPTRGADSETPSEIPDPPQPTRGADSETPSEISDPENRQGVPIPRPLTRGADSETPKNNDLERVKHSVEDRERETGFDDEVPPQMRSGWKDARP
jgi:hypothetical protein